MLANGTPEEIENKIDVNSLESWNEIKSVYDSLKNRNVSNIRINLGIVRGLDYYSGIVFEAFDTTFDIGALVGGGRYDSLPAALGRTDFGATGVAGGVERIILALENQNSKFKESAERISVLYVNSEMKVHAIKIASTLRENYVYVDIDLSDKSLKKQMEQSIDSKFAIIVAPKEFSSGMIVLRDMTERTEKQISIDNLLSELG